MYMVFILYIYIFILFIFSERKQDILFILDYVQSIRDIFLG